MYLYMGLNSQALQGGHCRYSRSRNTTDGLSKPPGVTFHGTEAAAAKAIPHRI